MTILEYTSASRIGGAETYLLRMVDVLRDRGHRVIAVTRGGSAIEKALKDKNVEVFGFHRGGKSPLPLWKLYQLLRREKVDVMHTHLFSAHSRAAWVGNRVSIPSVAHIHALGEGVEHLRHSTRMVAVANRLREEVIEQGVAASKVTVIPTGVNTADWENMPSPQEARRRLGLPPDARPISVVASLSPRKGHRFLLRALQPMIQNEKPGDGPLYALFAGEGSEAESLRLLAEELGITERVKFLGFCSKDKVRDVLAASEIVTLPSSSEGISISIMEAMAAKRAVVATNIAGMPELIEDGKSGLLVPIENENALEIAIRQILEDKTRQEKLAEAGRQRVKSHFEDNLCLAQMADFLEATARAGMKSSV